MVQNSLSSQLCPSLMAVISQWPLVQTPLEQKLWPQAVLSSLLTSSQPVAMHTPSLHSVESRSQPGPGVHTPARHELSSVHGSPSSHTTASSPGTSPHMPVVSS